MDEIAKEILTATQPRTQTATVCVDGRLQERLNALAMQVFSDAQTGQDDAAGSDAEREIEALLTQAEQRTYNFRFRSIGGDRWQKLKDDHAPSKEIIKRARDRGLLPPPYDDGFWPEALAASLDAVKKATDDDDAWQAVDWDADKVREVTVAWNSAQREEVQAAARAANEEGNALPKDADTYVQILRTNARSGQRGVSAGRGRSSTDDS